MNGTVIIDIRSLAEHWWAVALRGLFAIAFGVLTLALPTITLTALIIMFGAYALVEGTFNLVAAIRGRQDERPRWALLLEGIVSLAAGVVTLALPGLTALHVTW